MQMIVMVCLSVCHQTVRHSRIIWLSWLQRGYCTQQDLARWLYDGISAIYIYMYKSTIVYIHMKTIIYIYKYQAKFVSKSLQTVDIWPKYMLITLYGRVKLGKYADYLG